MGKKNFKKRKYLEITITNCPKCNSTNLAEFSYGLPSFTEELKKKIEEKKIILGGCEISFDNPLYFCNDCEHEF